MPVDPISLGLIGAGVGSSILGGLTARSPKIQKLSNFAPNQLQAQNQSLDRAMQMLQNPTQGFEPIRQNALNQFNNQIVPGLAARFGTSNARTSSPAFLQQLSSAGGDLSSQLGAQEAQYGQRQQQLGQNLLGMGLAPQFSYHSTAGGPTALSSVFSGLGQGLGAYGAANQQQAWNDQAQQKNFDQMKQMYQLYNQQQPAAQPMQQQGVPGIGMQAPQQQQGGMGMLDPGTYQNGPYAPDFMPGSMGVYSPDYAPANVQPYNKYSEGHGLVSQLGNMLSPTGGHRSRISDQFRSQGFNPQQSAPGQINAPIIQSLIQRLFGNQGMVS